MSLTGKTIGQTTYTEIIAQSAGSNSSDGVSGTFPFSFGDGDSLQFGGCYKGI